MRIYARSILSLFLALTWAGALVYLLLSQIMLPEIHPSRALRFAYRQVNQETQDLMHTLGFTDEPLLYPQSYHEEEWPVVVSAVAPEDIENFYGFMQTFHVHLERRKLVVYSLGLSEDEKIQLRLSCYCVIREVHWSKYPRHIADLSTGAYRPILIQESLLEFGSIMWCDPSVRITAPLNDDVDNAREQGLVAWPVPWPTSSLTHYNMFRFFNTSWSSYYFHRMVDPGRLLIFNTELVHKKIMLPWIECILDRNCLSPIGSQSVGCNFHQKPKFIYTGCHKYATSALNVILGTVFKFDTPYLGRAGVLIREHNFSESLLIGINLQHVFYGAVKV